jgi:predicted nuclease with TOPRIM domain
MNAQQLEEIKRHFRVVSEALRSDIRRIAEGHSTLCHELEEPRGEIRDEHKEMQALPQLSFSQFDQHSHTLETDLSDLKNRIDLLETSSS